VKLGDGQLLEEEMAQSVNLQIFSITQARTTLFLFRATCATLGNQHGKISTQYVRELSDALLGYAEVVNCELPVGVKEVREIPRCATTIDLSFSKITGDIKDLPREAETIDLRWTDVTGDVKDLKLPKVDCFDPVAGCWEAVAPMGIGRRFCAAAGSCASSNAEATAAGGCGWLCVFGGNGAGQSLSSAERFDTVTGRWVPLPPMRWARDDAAAATGLT